MNSRWTNLVSISLVSFTAMVMAWQLLHHDGTGKGISSESCIALSYRKGNTLAKIPGIASRAAVDRPGAGSWWFLNLALPKDTRFFLADMIGPTNSYKLLYYYYATYYLFPREVGVSVDHVTRLTKDGFAGRTSESDQEILTNGYDVRLDFGSGQMMTWNALRELPVIRSANPVWFDSVSDTGIAFVLPLLTALTGMWLFRFLFPSLSEQMPLLEQMACALGLGMMGVAAFTLGLKLCGIHGYYLVFLATAAGSAAEIWRDRKAFKNGIVHCWKKVRSPVIIAILMAGALVFLILFRLAGLQGLVEPDAIMAWSLKAKVMHLYTGNEMVQWFSNPRLANAHLDYPALVPSLHAATYDSLGHVDEFVTKFWPTWMLFFLLAALVSLNGGGKGRFYAPQFGLLGVLLLPATQKYVQMEGGTLPMVFFTVMGFVNCALWLVGKDPARLGLGLTLLFGAAMSKFEGFIFLALAGGWMLLLPSARPQLKLLPRFWRSVAFCLVAALPFVCLRLQIPTLNYESSWAGHALQHPTTLLSTLTNWARLFKIELSRLFVNPDFANWNGEGGQLHWIGKWDGLSSLYNPSTLALGWLCLLMSLALWFTIPTRRQIVIWIMAMFLGAVAALSGVFAYFVNITSLNAAISYTVDPHGARYLLPMLLAWFATTLTMLFANQHSSESTPITTASDPGTPTSAHPPAG
jgi:hypothetical protein